MHIVSIFVKSRQQEWRLTFVEIPRQRKAATVDVHVRGELNEDGGRRCRERLRTTIAAVAADPRRPCVVTVVQCHVVVDTTQATFDVQLAKRNNHPLYRRHRITRRRT